MSHGPPRRRSIPPARWAILEPLIDAALDLPSTDRPAFIAQACNGDLELRSELETFVAESEESGRWLERPASDRFPSVIDESAPPAFTPPPILAGRFRIEREIGRGGMAVVFLAHDDKHDRKVAVKIMRPTASSTTDARRFLAEIRVTAGFRHPNIVPLYDSGETDGWVFFVMPFLDGESLRARLDREGAVTPTDAIRLAREIASALAYAHARGVVHRDVKPSNVLLSGADTLLADFGIARRSVSASAPLTEAGLTVGTPAYMSPEQATTDQPVTPASDIYSLGCVLYEMLAGEAPCPAATRAALARHGTDPLVPLAVLRPSIAPTLASSVIRAMALAPGERFASAEDFARALQECADGVGSPPVLTARRVRRSTTRRRVAIVAASVVAAIGIALYAARDRVGARGMVPSSLASVADARLDTARWLLLPFEYGAGLSPRFENPDPLHDALRKWTGIRVVDRHEADDVPSATRGPAPISGKDARAFARAVGAGRYVIRSAFGGPSDIAIRAGLYDAGNGHLLNDTVVQLSRGSRNPDSVFAALAAYLLLPTVPESLRAGARATASRSALQAFADGQAAIRQWDLPRADTLFQSAVRFDAAYAHANLWLAQVRVWRGMPPPTWQFAANAAVAGHDRFTPRDREAAAALASYSSGDSSRACAIWMRLATKRPTDFAAWYGSALCQIRDQVVIPDSRSPSHWRFRASYQNATRALQRAFQILPATHRDFRATWYWSLGPMLNTMPEQIRPGHALLPDTGHFFAHASWETVGDSLVFVPYPVSDFGAGKPWTVPLTRATAILRQRAVFRDIATTWHAAFPRNADAMVALAMALDGLGDRTALDSLRVARSLAVDGAERLRAGAAEVWVRLKLSVPADPVSLRAARALAESLLAENPKPTPPQAAALASLAVLTGHPNRAAALARAAAIQNNDRDAPGAVRMPGEALLVFAAVGGPTDSLRALEQVVTAAIGGSIVSGDHRRERSRWLGRAATLAFPSYRSPLIREFAAGGDFAAIPQAAWLDHDSAKVRSHLAALRERRSSTLPEDRKLEVAYPEAWLLSSIGDVAAAVDWIGRPLDAQSRTNPQVLADVVGMGAFMRAMAFRAEMAQRAGDHPTAARWATAVIALWSDADPFLQPIVRQMRALSR